MSALGGASGETAGHAVEPDDGHTHENACLNCGAALGGAYCGQCGQKAHVHRTLSAFWHDLLHGVLHLEGKTWRTLPLLAWRPGELTRRYVEGERAKFVSPMAMFLFGIFLMFAVFNSIGGAFVVTALPQEQVERIQQLNIRSEVIRSETEALLRERARLESGSQSTGAVDVQLAELARSGEAVEAGRRLLRLQPAGESGNLTPRSGPADTGWPWLDHALDKFDKNPSLMLYKLQSNAYKFSWVLVPLSVPLLALLFIWGRRRPLLYDHTVFVTYSISFVTLLLVVLSLARVAGMWEDGVLLILATVVPVHMFRQLKAAYCLSFLGALWRTVALALSSLLVFALFLLLLIALGAL
jgi:hypothetical protein